LEERVVPDIVHLNSYVHGTLPFRAPTLVVGHSCVLSWWQAVKQESAPDTWNWYRHQVSRGLQAADLVVAPSHAMLAALQQHYGPLPAAEVIPNGRDSSSLIPMAKENFVFVAGRLWDQAKNLEAVVQAAPDLPWRVYVAGDCQAPDQAAVHPAHVCLLGQLTPAALAPWFGRAALYAFPARYEPFGLSVLEAGLCGCALVLGDIASLRENWEGAARFVPPDDVAALQETLRELMQRPTHLEESGRRARERALTFTPERMLTGYLSAYAELMMIKGPFPLPAAFA
jgi:glycosyltransferase involved in cell wall biosynthesis